MKAKDEELADAVELSLIGDYAVRLAVSMTDDEAASLVAAPRPHKRFLALIEKHGMIHVREALFVQLGEAIGPGVGLPDFLAWRMKQL